MPTKPKLQIRVASLDDAAVLQRLINTTFNRPHNGPINSAYFLTPTIITLVGVLNDEIVGTGSVHILQKIDRAFGQIEDVVVDSQYRKMGIGKQIIHQLIEHCKTQQCYKIILNSQENKEAFYRKMGFGKEEIQMVKRL